MFWVNFEAPNVRVCFVDTVDTRCTLDILSTIRASWLLSNEPILDVSQYACWGNSPRKAVMFRTESWITGYQSYQQTCWLRKIYKVLTTACVVLETRFSGTPAQVSWFIFEVRSSKIMRAEYSNKCFWDRSTPKTMNLVLPTETLLCTTGYQWLGLRHEMKYFLDPLILFKKENLS